MSAQAEKLRAAVIGMAIRYGSTSMDYAFAIADRSDDQTRLLRAQARRFAALQRLTRALANLAGGAS